MATLSDEFMQKMLDEEAWKGLANFDSDIIWSEALLEKYQDKVSWSGISSNRGIRWTIPMIQKFKNRINWDFFSSTITIGEELLPENILETFKDKWNWHILSSNNHVPLSYELLDKYADLWDWRLIIDRYGDDLFEGFCNIEFYERYKEHIPIAELLKSRLWEEMVYQQKRQLITEITAQDEQPDCQWQQY